MMRVGDPCRIRFLQRHTVVVAADTMVVVRILLHHRDVVDNLVLEKNPWGSVDRKWVVHCSHTDPGGQRCWNNSIVPHQEKHA